MMKKVRFLLIVLIISLLVLFPTLAQASKIKLKMMFVYGGATKEHIDRVVKEYTAKVNPNVEIITESVAGAGAATYQEVLQTRFLAGEGPDIYFEWGGELAGFFIDRGFAEPLEKYYKKYNWNSRFYPMVIDSIKRKGKIYGVPVKMAGMTFWYNKSVWNKLGLKEPKTYEEFEALCDKVKKAGIYPLTIGGKYGWMTMRLLDYLLELSCGPKLFDDLRALKVSWNRPQVVRAYTLFKKWVDNWVVPGFINITPDDSIPPFYQGKALMTFDGTWRESAIIADGYAPHDFDFFIPPTGHTPLRFSGFPEQFMISSKSKYKDEAAEFLNWYTSKEIMGREVGKAFDPLPPVIGIKIDEKALPNTAKWMKVLDTFEKIYPPTDQVLAPDLLHEFFEVQDGIVTGKYTPEQAAKRMDQAVKEWKAKQK
ncbi:MAG: extracellular solute-binding protein [Thermodesulfovibrio sp.]|nr:extracellular solute-binding protein [Thermodesulfovibrio sp.]